MILRHVKDASYSPRVSSPYKFVLCTKMTFTTNSSKLSPRYQLIPLYGTYLAKLPLYFPVREQIDEQNIPKSEKILTVSSSNTISS